MKKILSVAALFAACTVFAQAPAGVPMTVHIDSETSSLPEATATMLATRAKAAITNSGMGATEDMTQFYMTAKAIILDKHIVPGAPTKYFNTSEISFFIVDAFAGKEFNSMALEAKGVGNSEQQAYSNSIRDFKSTNGKLAAFLKDSNRKILAYYDSQYRNIIANANALALNHQYEEALFRLACIPEACAGYQESVNAALAIYRDYLDYKSYRALAKARTIWNAGQNSEAAAKAGEYLAEVDPNSKYYSEAVALNAEINARIKSDIDYSRSLDERAHKERMAAIDAWRQVGVAYGNGQKSNYFKSTF